MARDIANIMEQVASSKASHKKNCLALLNMMKQDASNVISGVFTAICRALDSKKDNPQAKLLLNTFIESFLGLLKAKSDGELSNQLAEYLLINLIPGIESGQKLVRVRIMNIIVLLLNFMEYLDDSVFGLLRTKLMERSRDKDIQVRVVAINALCRLQDDDEDLELVDLLIYCMQYDTSPLVRKSIISKITLTKRIFPFFIQRARDMDANTRISVYKKIFSEAMGTENFNFEDIRFLLRNGLNDRVESVRKECGFMLRDCWIMRKGNNIQQFLSDLDVVQNYDLAKLCLFQFFSTQKQFELEYSSDFWNAFNPENIVFLREYLSYCMGNSLNEAYDLALPELVLHVQYLKKYTTCMVSMEDEAEKMKLEAIIHHLLSIVIDRDFSDEVGRRELQLFLRTFLVNTDVDEECLQVAVKSLYKSSAGELDFLRIVTDILLDIEDADIDDSESQESKEVSASIRTLKCLDIVKCSFYFCQTSAETNEPMNALLERFVLPALQNSHIAIRCVGIECLGLVCLLSKQMALDNFKLFEFGFNSSDQRLAILCLKVLKLLFKSLIILDLFIIHGIDVFDSEESPNLLNTIIRKAMSCENEDVVILATEGAAKMFLLNDLQDKDILISLFSLYYIPIPSDKMKNLRQYLSFFLDFFCFSSYSRQKLIQEIFMRIIRVCAHKKLQLPEMIPINQIILHLIDWTDYRHIRSGQPEKYTSLHYAMAKSIAEYALENHSLLVRRSLCGCLTKCNLEGLFENDLAIYEDLLDLSSDLLKEVNGDLISTNALKRFSKLLEQVKGSQPLCDVEDPNGLEANPLDGLAALNIQH